jgi:hypothetical protein
MIEAGFEFSDNIDRVVAAIISLPVPLRPTHFSHEEKIEKNTDRIEDGSQFAAFVERNQSGFFLLGPSLTYSVRRSDGKPLICDSFIDVETGAAETLLAHMSKARPIFGFACAPGEREQRNRITVQQGANKIDSWVGRDTQKYVPGFYWLTLLSDVIAERHSIPFPRIESIAREYVALEGGQRLFRFYDRPEDWQSTTAVNDLCATLPGVFNIEEIKIQLSRANSFLELSSILRRWK